MPSHKIHIKIAQDINKELKLNNDLIMLGSVLPDLTIESHGVSHFQSKYEYPFNLASADEFIKKYPHLRDDISIGYMIHLLTDRFYNDWFYKNYRLKNPILPREYKHLLFKSYDEYLLKHYKFKRFRNEKIINKIPAYENISFDDDYIRQYIRKYNDEVESSVIDLNYKIARQNKLNKLYNNCLIYIRNWLHKNNIS